MPELVEISRYNKWVVLPSPARHKGQSELMVNSQMAALKTNEDFYRRMGIF